MHDYGFPVREIRLKRMVFSGCFSGYDKGGSGKWPSQVGSRRQNISIVFLWCLPPTPHLLLLTYFFLFSFFFWLLGLRLWQWQVGPLSDKEAKSGIPPLTLLPNFALTRVLTHRERSVPNQFFLQAFVLWSHSKFEKSSLKCTRSPTGNNCFQIFSSSFSVKASSARPWLFKFLKARLISARRKNFQNLTGRKEMKPYETNYQRLAQNPS